MNKSNFFHNLIFDIGYGVRKCIENQNFYPYEKIFIDTSDKNYTNDIVTGFFVLFSFFLLCFFVLSLIYDIITSPIYITLALRRWYKTIVEEEKRKKKMKSYQNRNELDD
uniref:Plasmodium vivax Vir protein n=1 Tax=Strongyloides venezuelensis TaxID=75913 RepID=A0A0K0F9J5_STRVS